MPTVVYNLVILSAWQKEAALLNERIPQYRQAIEAHRVALFPLQRRLQTVQSEMDSIQSSITWAEINQAQERSNHWRYSHCHGHYPYHQPDLLHTLADISSIGYLNSLYNQRSRLNATRAQLRTEIRPLESNIDVNTSALQRATANLTQLNDQIAAGSTFLNMLKTNPGQLVAQLKGAIVEAFKAYDDKNPTDRSPQVRICLYNLQEKLNYLSVAAEHATIKNLQLNYLDLCALLQNMHVLVGQQERQDSEFHAILTTLLNSTHIATNGDLPDEMQTGQSTSVRFGIIAAQNPQLLAITSEQLLVLEEQRYEQKLIELENGIFVDEMQKRIKAVTDAIKTEVTTKKLKNEAIDYHFYTRIIQDVWQAVNHPKDHKTIQHLNVLAQAASGSPSIGKKVVGALVALAGALLVTASIACLIATFGGSALASGFGAALGVSLVQSQICIGVAASVTAVSGTGLSFWGGIKFKEGMRQGLSKDIADLKQEVETGLALA